jgi:succinoglycan biosynthesis protein ExoA
VGQLFRQYRRYGRGKPRVAARHPSSVRIRHLAPPALVLWLAAAAAVGVRRPAVGLLAVAPYALAVGGAGARISRQAPGSVDARAVSIALVTMHLAWGLGFWEGLLDVVRTRGQR